MRAKAMLFSELQHHMKGANWKQAKIDGVVERIQKRRGERGFGMYLGVGSDGVTTTVGYGDFIGVARCCPTDTPVFAVGVAIASARLARSMAQATRGRA